MRRFWREEQVRVNVGNFVDRGEVCEKDIFEMSTHYLKLLKPFLETLKPFLEIWYGVCRQFWKVRNVRNISGKVSTLL